MKPLQCGLLLAILAMTASVERTLAFDIAVYYDARSALNYRCQREDTMFCGTISRQDAIDNIENEGDVFNWWNEMGVTHAIVHYPFDDDLLTLNDRDHTDIKILNASYPGETRKYLEAQNRDIYVGNSTNNHPNYVSANCWGNVARGDTQLTIFSSSINSLYIQSADTGTMWKPEADLGIWEGWDWHEAKISGKIFMPMHFRIVCNLIPVDNPPGDQEIARFYWMVRYSRDENWDGVPEFSGWIRYPAQVITVDSCGLDQFLPDTINFTIDPSPGEPARFQLLDSSFQEVPDSVYDRHAFGALWGEPVRMWIEYQGDNQIFQVHRVQIWDEGYHQNNVLPTNDSHSRFSK